MKLKTLTIIAVLSWISILTLADVPKKDVRQSWGIVASKNDTSEVYANVSAYCSCQKCCEKWSKYKTTASGHKIKKGDKFAAAPKNIPFGTMIIVKGYNDGKPVPVLDRGGAIKGNKIDLYFDTHKEAIQWGRKKMNIKIVKKG
jgi:3D (Asp-Asp-Asp) domain-containing protein